MSQPPDEGRELELLQRVQQQMGKVLEELDAVREPVEDPQCWEPAADVLVEGEHLVVLMDLPGVHEEQITLSLRERILVVSGEWPEPCRDPLYQRQERPRGRFRRRFLLPQGFDENQLQVHCVQGVLHIRLPQLAGSLVPTVLP
ncbi:MAG: Hsp20/alpha crystallin family protein [Desulfuromonadaceae bacterium]|nr:Hsp20/alpha crystallin family protein [Desulfuromonadaceae bacterium]